MRSVCFVIAVLLIAQPAQAERFRLVPPRRFYAPVAQLAPRVVYSTPTHEQTGVQYYEQPVEYYEQSTAYSQPMHNSYQLHRNGRRVCDQYGCRMVGGW
jgi:hypothetical protein